MSFKEVFESYKNGTATENDKKLVEDELEKYEVLNDYLFDSIENDLKSDKTLPLENEKESNDFTRLIQKSIRHAFVKLGISVTAVILAVVIFIQLGLSPVLDSLYYDPTVSVGDFGKKIDLDMGVYTELCNPLNKHDNVMATSTGYGTYDFSTTTGWHLTRKPQVYAGEISRNKLTLYTPGLLDDVPINMFAMYGEFAENSWVMNGPQEAYERLKAQNDTDYFKAYISFKKDLSFDEIKELEKTYGFHLAWYAIRTVEDNYFGLGHMGFLNSFNGYMLTGWDEEAYPYLLIPGNDREVTFEEMKARENDEKIMTQHFLSQLQYMADNKDFTKMVKKTTEEFQSAHDYVLKNGMKSYGCVIHEQKEMLLNMLEDENVYSIYIEP